jgi:hypothetical protein
MWRILVLAIAGWLICSFFAWGLHFAYFQRNWPNLAEEQYARDLGIAISTGLIGGPIALVVELCLSHGKGLRWF